MNKDNFKNEKICLTGGGTGGHITPLLAIYKQLGNEYDFFWIGEENSLEEKISKDNNIRFLSIKAGKLRRYFSLKTILEPFRILAGIGKSYLILKKENPKLIISKGGYVSLPVAIAAKFLGFKLFLHESDTIPGLANRRVGKFASKVYLGFEEASQFFSIDKVQVIGQILSPELVRIKNGELRTKNNSISINVTREQSETIQKNPIRHSEFISESKIDAEINSAGRNNETIHKTSLIDHHELLETSYNDEKTKLLIIAGSQGSSRIFGEILSFIENLSNFQISVILGTLNLKYKSDFEKYSNVVVYDFVDSKKMGEILNDIDIAITRAGATSLAELENFAVKMIIIPLTESANNHQYFNALAFKKKGEIMLEEKDLSNLKNEIIKLNGYKKALFKQKANKALDIIKKDIDSF